MFGSASSEYWAKSIAESKILNWKKKKNSNTTWLDSIQHLDAITWRLSGLFNKVKRSVHIESFGVVVGDEDSSDTVKQDRLNHTLWAKNTHCDHQYFNFRGVSTMEFNHS